MSELVSRDLSHMQFVVCRECRVVVALFGSVEVLSGPDEVGRCAAGLAAAAASCE